VSLSKAGAAEEFIWDSELDGFALRLRRRVNGDPLRNYVVQYRANGHTRRMTIKDVVTPAQARKEARKVLAQVELGKDPQADKKLDRQQATHTVRSVVAAYLEARKPSLRPESFRTTKLYLDGSYFRRLHPMAISAVTRADVATCIRAIVSKHSGPTAAAARRALSAFFSWAIADGLLGNGANPVDGSHRPDDPAPREHTPTGPELAAIWNACDGTGDFDKIVRLLILLGSRRSEVGGMCWSEIDLNAGTWTLPGQRSKNHRAHTITLPPAALAIIESIPRTSRDNLFGDRSSDGFTCWDAAKRALDRRLGQTVRPWRLHDTRRGVATAMADDLHIEPHHVEAVLNHWSGSRSGIAQVYNRATYAAPVAAALNRWAKHVLALAEGRESNIVTTQRA
jgi:integrase